MHIIELSNHPRDMLDKAARTRVAAEKRMLSLYEEALIRYRARVETIRVKRDRAWAHRRWREWLRLAFAGWREKRKVPSPPIPAAGHTDAEEEILAGIEGEQLVATELGRALDDDWTLLSGYRNRRGEIDHLLLGPRGLFAVEVKNLNATVHVDGDRWRADKYDKYGHLVQQRLILDRTGRSPSVQLNEPADELERFLRRRGQPVSVQRVVVLAHRRSRLGEIRGQTVAVGVSAGYLLALVRESAEGQLDGRRRAEVQRLIRRDHEFHDRRARSGPR